MEDTPTSKLSQLRNQGHKLKLNKFHRYLGQESQRPKHKNKYLINSFQTVSNRKKIRDLERLITREGMPNEIIESKKSELAELKKKEKYKKEAKRNFSKYKQIRFHEKKKCLRKIKKAENEIKTIEHSSTKLEDNNDQETKDLKLSELKDQLSQLQRDLEYICHFPSNHKYISLYTSNEMNEETLKKREDLRRIIRSQVQAREAFKKREMKLVDKQADMNVVEQEVDKDQKIKNLRMDSL